MARHLDAWGFPIRVIWFAARNQLRGDAAAQWEMLQRSRINQSAFLRLILLNRVSMRYQLQQHYQTLIGSLMGFWEQDYQGRLMVRYAR